MAKSWLKQPRAAIPVQARRRSPNSNCWVQISSSRVAVGVFHVKGWGPKSFVCASRPGRTNVLVGYPGKGPCSILTPTRCANKVDDWPPTIVIKMVANRRTDLGNFFFSNYRFCFRRNHFPNYLSESYRFRLPDNSHQIHLQLR